MLHSFGQIWIYNFDQFEIQKESTAMELQLTLMKLTKWKHQMIYLPDNLLIRQIKFKKVRQKYSRSVVQLAGLFLSPNFRKFHTKH